MLSDATMQEIANMTFEDIVSPEVKFQDIIDTFEEYNRTVDTINCIVPAYQNIKEFGVTKTIYNTYNDLLWDKVQFDLTPFVDCATEQLMYGIEGLGSVIRRIYEVLRNIIWRIKDFFTDSIFAKWFNPCQKVYDNVVKTRDLCRKNGSTLNVDKFSKQLVNTFDYSDFSKRLDALDMFSNAVNGSLGSIDKLDMKIIQGNIIYNKRINDLHIKLSASGKTVELEPTNLVRVNTIFEHGWNGNNFLQSCEAVDRVCKRGIVMKSKITMIERALVMTERNIADVLTGKKEPQVVKDEASIKALNLYLSILNVTYDLIRGAGNHWCLIGRAYLNSCDSYKPGLFS